MHVRVCANAGRLVGSSGQMEEAEYAFRLNCLVMQRHRSQRPCPDSPAVCHTGEERSTGAIAAEGGGQAR